MSVILKGVNFGKCFISAGTLNFFGEGWRMPHKFYELLPGFNFTGTTFISKTTTIDAREGNMRLKEDLQPKELFPRCIKAYPSKKIMLNAVGLSGPGAEHLFRLGKWQAKKEPFFISFMAVNGTKEERWNEMRRFICLTKNHLPYFNAKIGLEINFSCPNAGHDTEKLINEAADLLTIARELNLPLIAKVNALINPLLIKNLVLRGLCDAISVSNTIPYGQLPDDIDWEDLFGKESPLKKYGGGGLSGQPLLPITASWITKARHAGIAIPIIGGGGILSEEDVDLIKAAGANAMSISSVAILRPWKVADIIYYANTGERRNKTNYENHPDFYQPNFYQPFGPTLA